MYNNEAGERHVPKHPLPKEIQNMPQSETVCQFCGVSYLIHHEIKKLEEKITLLEKQLVGYNDMKNQKNDLNQKIDKNKNEISQLKQSLYENKSLLTDKVLESENLQNENEKLKKLSDGAQNELKVIQKKMLLQKNSYLTSLKNVNSKVNEFKKEFHEVKQYSKDIIPQFQNYILKTEKRLVKRVMCEIERFQQNEFNFESSLQQVKVLRNELELSKNKINKQESELEKEKKLKSKLMFQLDSDCSKLKMDLEDYQLANAELSTKIENLEKEVSLKNKSFLEATENIRYKEQKISDCEIKFQAKIDQIESESKSQLKRYEEEQLSFYNKLKNIKAENNVMTSKIQKKDETIKSLQSQVDFSREENKSIKQISKEATEKITKLVDERKRMIMEHQEQIVSISKKFQQDIASLQNNTHQIESLKKELTSKYEEKILQIKEKLQVENNIEVERQKNDAISKHQKLQKEYIEQEGQLQAKIEELTRKLNSTSHSLKLYKVQVENKEVNHNLERESLQNIVNELQEKLSKVTVEKYSSEVSLELKQLKEKIEKLVEVNEDLKKVKAKQKLQIEKLEETVRRECEERFELLNALNIAQTQLSKENNSNNNNSLNREKLHNQLPVSAINSLSPILKSPQKLPTSHESQYSKSSSRCKSSRSSSRSLGLPSLVPKQESKSKKKSSDSNSRNTDVDVNFLRKRIANAIKRR